MACLTQAGSGQVLYTEDLISDGKGTWYTSRGRGAILLTVDGNPGDDVGGTWADVANAVSTCRV
jgi:hypothetical protein